MVFMELVAARVASRDIREGYVDAAPQEMSALQDTPALFDGEFKMLNETISRIADGEPVDELIRVVRQGLAEETAEEDAIVRYNSGHR